MLTTSRIQKSYVETDDTFNVICPACSFSKRLSTKKFGQRKHQLSIKCTCGERYKLQLEYRAYHRKEVDSLGICIIDSFDEEPVKLLNLSLGGVCLKVILPDRFQPGHKGVIKFKLDDPKRTEIQKHIKIKSISGEKLHCEFIKDRAFEKELGFYLRP